MGNLVIGPNMLPEHDPVNVKLIKIPSPFL